MRTGVTKHAHALRPRTVEFLVQVGRASEAVSPSSPSSTTVVLPVELPVVLPVMLPVKFPVQLPVRFPVELVVPLTGSGQTMAPSAMQEVWETLTELGTTPSWVWGVVGGRCSLMGARRSPRPPSALGGAPPPHRRQAARTGAAAAAEGFAPRRAGH
jgi:hypothetical protein